MIEQVHRQLKASLMYHNDTWVRSVPLVLLGMRAAFKEDIGATAAEMLYGEPLRLPGELLMPAADTDTIFDAADFVSTI
ncbi:unnamed protein product [Colias eurytheme]|nr:unnamed protein product [Colias eurytheme]